MTHTLESVLAMDEQTLRVKVAEMVSLLEEAGNMIGTLGLGKTKTCAVNLLARKIFDALDALSKETQRVA